MGSLNYFEMKDILEPHCPNCNVVLNYGFNTTYDDAEDAHKCNGCGHLLR